MFRYLLAEVMASPFLEMEEVLDLDFEDERGERGEREVSWS